MRDVILAYLRSQIGALPQNVNNETHNLHIPIEKKMDVHPPQHLRNVQPIYDPQQALNRLVHIWSNYDAKLLGELYPAFKLAIANGLLKPTKRHGRKWLYCEIVVLRKRLVNAKTIDAILVLLLIHVEQSGIIRLNPLYTGRAPYPRYLVVGRV